MVTVRKARKPWRSKRVKTSPASARTRSSTKAASSVSTSKVSCSPTEFGSHSFETGLSERPRAWANASHVQHGLGLRTDAGDHPDGQGIEERLDVGRRDDHQAVGLPGVGGDLGDELVGAEAHRARESFALDNLVLDLPRALGGGVEA